MRPFYQGGRTAAKAIVLAVLLADLSSATLRAYACLLRRPGSEVLNCEEQGEILPQLGFKLATALTALTGRDLRPAPQVAPSYHRPIGP